ncbi:protein Red-like [Hydractinia symbiolongicarpus]|uniref:protein Red-like n=1 Tax=Hydractinia symbiolongicarpus TaxID=13093 RepID=UPI00254B7522|nr:protein Red-like [Hydractinia symbiolongicarpus]
MPTGSETFSNPVAPASSKPNEPDEDEQRLTNADFRSLLMTPRAQPKVPPPSKQRPGALKDFSEADDASAKRRKKKLYYAKLRQQEEERQKELASKYRDRATERREGKNSDYQYNDAPDLGKTAEYRAVAPTADQVNSAAERRRLAIQESKFLGGDMEHTHLVKGLDFALLQKVRSEIASIESEETVEESTTKSDKKEENKPDVEFVSVLGRKIHKAAMVQKPPLRNDLFLPGRMAYVFNLDDEYDESDIPTTTIRSKADCPLIENQTTLTTNDIVINKLTQILSYLRQGVRASKKLKKREKELIRAGKDPRMEESIFADAGNYNADNFRDNRSRGKNHHRSSAKSGYFGNNERDTESTQYNKYDTSVKDLVKNINERYGSKNSEWKEVSKSSHKESSKKSKHKSKEVIDSYAECYPGAMEMNDAAGDSDDDADYSKMDMGNKKGPLKRWDFENEEDYNSYMENKEAMPKAAFQFGIKMQEGRKTRSRPGKITEKQKLDREWQQISSLIAKRKSDGGSGYGGKKSKGY